MNWHSWIKAFGSDWPCFGKDGFDFRNKYQGSGTGQSFIHSGYKQNVKKKAKAKNRNGKKARKQNRKNKCK